MAVGEWIIEDNNVKYIAYCSECGEIVEELDNLPEQCPECKALLKKPR